MGESKEGRSEEEEEKGRMKAIVISRLCRLVFGALPPDIECSTSLAPLTKQGEKDLLLSLSRVLKEIRQWKVQLDRNLDLGTSMNTLYDEDCSLHMPNALERKATCLANVTFTMVTVVGSRSSFVQHLARNILVAISSLLSKFDSKWILLLRFLWISLEISMSSMAKSIPPSSSLGVLNNESLLSQYSLIQDMSSGAEYPCFEILKFVNLLQTKSYRDNGQMVAGLFHILYSILKLLKHEDSDLEEMYTHLAISSLVKMPWNLLVETHFNYTCIHLKSNNFDMLDDTSELKDTVLATILQFLCSLVENDFIEANSDPSGELPLSFQYTEIILKLLPSFSQHLICSKRSISLYLRHKLLMLMIRLTSQSHCCGSYFFRLLKLLKQYFGDFLYKSISEYDANCVTSIEDSPFFSSFDDGRQVRNLCTRHLHRQIIFLFLKCCLKLDSFSDKSTPQSSSGEVIHVSSIVKNCSHVGAMELFEWIGKCAFLDEITDIDIYTVSLCGFTRSFLQFYMEEDDMLFDMLLQLLDAPFIALQEQNGEKSLSIEEMKTDIVFTISRVFNPIQLFHMFLLLLHFDHLVLIDYLISKDTGTRFLQYLLRCLRMICRSWETFFGFSVTEDLNQPCIKRRKIIKGSCKLVSENFNPPSYVVKEWKAAQLNVKKINIDYENVKDCLMSLRMTVEDMDQKKSFPYNPQPLLKSLIKFEELCNEKKLGWRNI